jgi:hypothetical protein
MALKFKKKAVWIGSGKKSIPPRPEGRKLPNWRFEVTEEVLDKIEQLSVRVRNRDQLAYLLDTSPSTLYERRGKEPCPKEIALKYHLDPDSNPLLGDAIEAAIKKGRSKGITAVENVHFEMALRKDTYATGERIFFLKNHAGYRDAQSLEHSGVDGGPIKSETTVKREYTDEQRAIRLASILAAAEQRAKQSKEKSGKGKLRFKK